MVLLDSPLSKTGHFWYQLASRQELVTNPAIMEAATELNLGKSGTKQKRRTTSEVPGGVFRFAAVLNQFDAVWDLYAMKMATRTLGHFRPIASQKKIVPQRRVSTAARTTS